MSAKTLEVIRAIAQAAANSYDGAHDEKYTGEGNSKVVGLKREEGDLICWILFTALWRDHCGDVVVF